MIVGQPFNPMGLFVGCFIPNVILKNKILSSSSKLVWGRLAQFAGHDGKCYPKQSTLVEELGMARSTVQMSLQQLEREGFVRIVNPSGRDRLQHSNNNYEFLWHESFEPDLRKPEIRSPEGISIGLPNKEVNNKEEIKEKYKKEKNFSEPPSSTNRRSVRNRNKPLPPKNFLHVFPENYQNSLPFANAWNAFCEERKQKVPITERAAVIIRNKLRQSCKTDVAWATECINQSVESGYRGVFITNRKQQSEKSRQIDTAVNPFQRCKPQYEKFDKVTSQTLSSKGE